MCCQSIPLLGLPLIIISIIAYVAMIVHAIKMVWSGEYEIHNY
ncbi:MAG: hypothetical protein WCW02_01985 [Candidatus Buchananbacteria bacterium]